MRPDLTQHPTIEPAWPRVRTIACTHTHTLLVLFCPIHNFFTCRAWVLPVPCLALAESVKQCCTELFHTLLLDYFSRCTAHKIGRFNKLIVQDNSLLCVMGQESYEFLVIINNTTKITDDRNMCRNSDLPK